MEKALLITNLRNFVPITDEEYRVISSHLTERHFSKGDFITKEGEVNRYTNFRASLITRFFVTNSLSDNF